MAATELHAEDYIRLIKNHQKEVLLAQEAENEGLEHGYLFIQYEKILFEPRQVIPAQVSMIIPQSFTLMEEAVIRAKYPEHDRPDYIYTSGDSKINLTFSIDYGLIDHHETDDICNKIRKQMQRLYPGIEISGDRLIHSEQTLSYFSFTIPVIDGRLFHLMYFMEFQHHLLIGGFNCSSYDQKNWLPVFIKMMNTIKIVNTSNHSLSTGSKGGNT